MFKYTSFITYSDIYLKLFYIFMASVRLTILTLHNKSIFLSTHQVTMIHCIVGNLDQNSKGLRHGDKSFCLGYNQQDWKWRMLVTYTSCFNRVFTKIENFSSSGIYQPGKALPSFCEASCSMECCKQHGNGPQLESSNTGDL